MSVTEDEQAHGRLETMLSKLKSRNFRLTPQRLAVLEILALSENHPSAEQVYVQVRRRFPTTSLATIYKTLALLKDLGEILELGFADAGARYDGAKPFPHPHIICVKCKKIMDPQLAGLDDIRAEIVDKTGFRIISHRLDFFGVCEECQKQTT